MSEIYKGIGFYIPNERRDELLSMGIDPYDVIKAAIDGFDNVPLPDCIPGLFFYRDKEAGTVTVGLRTEYYGTPGSGPDAYDLRTGKLFSPKEGRNKAIVTPISSKKLMQFMETVLPE